MKHKKKRAFNLPKAAWGEILNTASSLSGMIPGVGGIAQVGLGIAGDIVGGIEADKLVEKEDTNRQRGLAFNKSLSNVQNYDLNIPTFAMGGQMGQDPSRMGMGMQQGMQQQGMQMEQEGIDSIQGNKHENGGTNIGNIVEAEEGETKEKDIIYSDRLKISSKDVKDYSLPGSYKGKTIASVSKMIDKQFGLRKYDSIGDEERQRRLDVLTEIQEDKKVEMDNKRFEGDMEGIGMEVTDEDRAMLEQRAQAGMQGQGQGVMQVPENQNIGSPENQQAMQMQMMQQGQGMPQMWAGGQLPKAFGGINMNKVKDGWDDEAIINNPYSGDFNTFENNAVVDPNNDIRFTSNGNPNDFYGGSGSNDSELSLSNPANQGFIEEARLQREQSELRAEVKGKSNQGYGYFNPDPVFDEVEKEDDTRYLNDMRGEDTSNPELSNYKKFGTFLGDTGKSIASGISGEFGHARDYYRNKRDGNDVKYGEGYEKGSSNDSSGKSGNMKIKYDDPNRIRSNLGNIWSVGRGIYGLTKDEKTFDRVAPEYVRAANVDPTRAIQDTTTSYGNANASLRNNSRGVGSYLSNMLALRGSEAKTKAGIHSQYDNMNAGFANTANVQNSQIGMSAQTQNAATQKYEEQVNQQERDAANNMIQHGLTDMSTNYMMRKRDKNFYNRDKETAKYMNMMYENWYMSDEGMNYRKSING